MFCLHNLVTLSVPEGPAAAESFVPQDGPHVPDCMTGCHDIAPPVARSAALARARRVNTPLR
jgi:hypothetical protein